MPAAIEEDIQLNSRDLTILRTLLRAGGGPQDYIQSSLSSIKSHLSITGQLVAEYIFQGKTPSDERRAEETRALGEAVKKLK